MEMNSFQPKAKSGEEVLLCKRCMEKNKKRKLHLYQINLEEGIFLCPSQKCGYPLQEADVLKFIRKRKLSELGSSTSKKLKVDNEDAFWNEVFSPEVAQTHIVEVISSMSSDGSTGKISDMDDMVTDFETVYPLQDNSQQPDSLITQQNNKPCNGELLVHSSSLLDGVPDVTEICKEPSVVKQHETFQKDAESTKLEEMATKFVDQQTCLSSESNNSKQQCDILNNVSPPEQLSNLIEGNAEKEPSLTETQVIADDHVIQVQQKGQNKENVVAMLPKEHFTASEGNCSPVAYEEVDSDKSMQSSAKTCSGLLEQSNNSIPKNRDQIPSEVTEMENVEVQTVSLLSDNSRIYPLWKNSDSLCWLDATLCLLVHNQTLKSHIKQHKNNKGCHLQNIIRTYEKASSLVNNECPPSQENAPSSKKRNVMTMLNNVREDTFAFLQKTMQCTKGRNDSPVFSIPLLLRENKAINELFLMEYRWELSCKQCGEKKIDRTQKVLPTFPSVADDFSMLNACFLRPCFYCDAPQQKRYLRFDKLPNSFLIHFVQGLPYSIDKYDFTYDNSEYKITSIIQYLTEPTTHFVTWVRNVKRNLWLCCDDLQNLDAAAYSDHPPAVHPSQLHILSWERQTHSIACSKGEKGITVQADRNDIEVIENPPPQQLIVVSGDKSDHCDELAETSSEVTEKSNITGKENSTKSVLEPCNKYSATKTIVIQCSEKVHNQSNLHTTSDEVSMDSHKIKEVDLRKIHNEINNNIVTLEVFDEKVHQYNAALPSTGNGSSPIEPKEKVIISNKTKHNHTELSTTGDKSLSDDVSVTDIGITLVQLDNSDTCMATSENVNSCDMVPEYFAPIVTTETKKGTLLPEGITKQTIKALNCDANGSADNAETAVFWKEGNIRNYSRMNGFSACNKNTIKSNQRGLVTMKSSPRKELKKERDCKENCVEANGRVHCDTKKPNSLSLAMHSDVTESSASTEKNESGECHRKNVAGLTFRSPTAEHHKLSARLAKNEQVPNEMKIRNMPSSVSLQNFEQDVSHLKVSSVALQNEKAKPTVNNGDFATNDTPSLLQIASSFAIPNGMIPDGILPDGTCIEICEEVPMDVPIADDCVRYLVEIEYPPTVTEPTSQIIVLNNEKLKNVCVQDINHTQVERSQILLPGGLHFVPEEGASVEVITESDDTILLPTTNEIGSTKSKKPRSCRKKPTKANANDRRSTQDIRKEPLSFLPQKHSKISDYLPNMWTALPNKKAKGNAKPKKSNIFEDLKFALDFSEDSPNSVQVLSSLSHAKESKVLLNRGKMK